MFNKEVSFYSLFRGQRDGLKLPRCFHAQPLVEEETEPGVLVLEDFLEETTVLAGHRELSPVQLRNVTLALADLHARCLRSETNLDWASRRPPSLSAAVLSPAVAAIRAEDTLLFGQLFDQLHVKVDETQRAFSSTFAECDVAPYTVVHGALQADCLRWKKNDGGDLASIVEWQVSLSLFFLQRNRMLIWARWWKTSPRCSPSRLLLKPAGRWRTSCFFSITRVFPREPRNRFLQPKR